MSIQSYASSSSSSGSFYFYRFVERHFGILGLVVSSASLGAVITYPFLLYVGNTISKKDEILIAAFLYFSGKYLVVIILTITTKGSLLQSTSGELNWDNAGGLSILIIGRFLYGGGIAATLHSVPQYISEVMPVNVRGFWGSTTEVKILALCFNNYIYA